MLTNEEVMQRRFEAGNAGVSVEISVGCFCGFNDDAIWDVKARAIEEELSTIEHKWHLEKMAKSDNYLCDEIDALGFIVSRRSDYDEPEK